MKPAPFEYLAPETISDTLRALARHGADGKLLAGGQSLVPLLNFRLARPATLIDINRVAALSYIRRRDRDLQIGALTRQAALEASTLAAREWPLLGAALAQLAHPQIRNRGTVGGSVAHADPAAELPVALTALDATFAALSLRGSRELTCAEMFAGPLTSGLADDELLVEIRVPPTAPAAGWAFEEFARRHGDFALGGVAVQGARGGDRFADGLRIVLLGAAPVPLRASEAERVAASAPFDAALAERAAQAAAAAAEPSSDLHAGADYRRALLGSLTRRALLAAWERAR